MSDAPNEQPKTLADAITVCLPARLQAVAVIDGFDYDPDADVYTIRISLRYKHNTHMAQWDIVERDYWGREVRETIHGTSFSYGVAGGFATRHDRLDWERLATHMARSLARAMLKEWKIREGLKGADRE